MGYQSTKLSHKCQCCPHINLSQLIYTANQLTGFYVRAPLAFNELIHFRVKILFKCQFLKKQFSAKLLVLPTRPKFE